MTRGLPGPPPHRKAGGGGYGAGYGGGFEAQPGLWILPVGAGVLLVGGAWILDQLTAALCHFDGCVSTHYLIDLLHVAEVALAVVGAGAVAAVGYRRGWHRAVLLGLAWSIWQARRSRARRSAARRAAATTVSVTVEDVIDVEAEDVAPRALAAAGDRSWRSPERSGSVRHERMNR